MSQMIPDLSRWMRPLAWANLVANVSIVVSGGAVRLTGSGLGCPTWPRCTEDSFVPHGELGVHGVIEFGNRTLTFVLVAVATACFVAALQLWLDPARPGLRGPRAPLLLSTVIALGVPAQAVIGGVSVLTALNPWVVSLHLLVSMAIVAVCVLLLDVVRGPERRPAPAWFGRLTWLVLASGWLVLWLGTVVTGSGPHSGDLHSERTGLDPQVVSHVHAASVYLLVTLTLVTLAAAWRARLRASLRAAAVLLGVEVAQGSIGFLQYFNDLPELLVGIHLLGAALTSAGLAWLVITAHARLDGVMRTEEAPTHAA